MPNDTITIDNSGASFHDDVGTAAPRIVGAGYGTFFKGYQVKQRPIALPSLGSLSTLSALATVSKYNLPAVTTGSESGVLERIEFIATDLNSDADSTDDNEGFFRVYKAKSGQAEWLRAHGIDDLVTEGRRVWQERAGIGDLAAVKARSRINEAEALLDEDGLGAFRVLEWIR